MTASPFKIGSEIEVTPFLYTTPLVVEILSAESFDHGGSARIFKGRVKLQAPYQPYDVALKVISHAVSEDRSELVRRELETVSKLAARSMRRILPFIGTAFVGFHPVIVTEFMKNGNMMQYFQWNRPTADRQRLLIQVAEAVYWLHDFKNLVHGDLKCENVLINDDENAVLADFGLSTLIEPESSSVTTSTDIRNLYTIRFAAPELRRRGRHARRRRRATCMRSGCSFCRHSAGNTRGPTSHGRSKFSSPSPCAPFTLRHRRTLDAPGSRTPGGRSAWTVGRIGPANGPPCAKSGTCCGGSMERAWYPSRILRKPHCPNCCGLRVPTIPSGEQMRSGPHRTSLRPTVLFLTRIGLLPCRALLRCCPS